MHRDIHWIGRQWAVTGYGMQAIDQRHVGQFDIEIAHLWDDDLLERLSGQKWFNLEDFSKGLAIARKRYPGPPRAIEPESTPLPESASPPPPVATPLPAREVIAPPPIQADVPEPEAPKSEPIKQARAAPPEDLLGKWFEAYGLDKAPSPAPTPQRDAVVPEPVAKPPEQAEPVATVEQTPTPELPAEPAQPGSAILHMPIPGRARFVRPWRVQIHAVRSYRLRDPIG